jgi:hypothetical protein
LKTIKTLLILFSVLVMMLIPCTAFAEETSESSDPEQILTDPDFDLNSVNSDVLSAWYASTVTVSDANLRKALKEAVDVGDDEDLTVEDMLRLPTTLDLSDLSIESLAGMKYAINVKSLDISGNSLTSISELQNLYNLETLDYSGNSVKVVPAWIFTSDSLEEVNGASNGSTYVYTFSGTSALEKLYLESNSLSSLPDLSGCKNLQVLSLANNQFTTFPTSILDLTSLETLSLSGNELTEVPDLSALDHLKTLHLDNNEITEMPTGLGSLSTLTELTMNYNELTAISEDIMASSTLETLAVTFNSITELPEALVEMSSLKTLEVSVNAIDLSASADVIQALSESLQTFTYKLQTPHFTLQLYYERGVSGGRLVWDGISDITDDTEGYLTISKFVIERKEETLDEDGNVVEDTSDSGKPKVSVYETLAEVDANVREYIDDTAEEGTNYTYRVTAYVTGMYEGSEVIDTSGSETVNTKDMIGESLSTQDLIKYIALGAVAAGALIASIIILIRKRRKAKPRNNKEDRPKKQSASSSAEKELSQKPKKKRKKIKITRIKKQSPPIEEPKENSISEE